MGARSPVVMPRAFLKKALSDLPGTWCVEYTDPFELADGSEEICQLSRIEIHDAVKVSKAIMRMELREYENDEIALDDFVVIHWGMIKKLEG
jgi:hypothetical protein